MASGYLLGFDIGGSNVRCLAYNISNGEHVSETKSWSHHHATGFGHWAYDLDTDNLWKILGEVCSSVLLRAKIPPQEILGIAVSSMRHGLVLTDDHGEVIFSTPNTDARANSQLIDIIADQGEHYYQRTGHWPSPIFMPSRLLWLSKNQPEVLAATRTVFSISDWVNCQLTGVIFAERSQAAESMLLDIHTREWAFDLISAMDLKTSVFPVLVDAGSKIGSLTDHAAEHLDLISGIPVSTGGADTQCGLLGLGVIHPDQLGIIAGSTAPIQLVSAGPILDAKARLWTGLHVVPNLYVIESNAGSMGSTLRWFAEMVYPENPDAVRRFTAQASRSSISGQGVFSSVGATLFNASEMTLPIDTLSFSPFNFPKETSNQSAFSRAILEGMAYAIRANVEQIQEISKSDHETVWMGGGMVKSPTWRKIVSNVLNCGVCYRENSESTAIGTVICAGVGAGIYPKFDDAVESIVTNLQEVMPDSDVADLHHDYYEDWCALQIERKEVDLLTSNFMIESISGRQLNELPPQHELFQPRIYVSADVDEHSLARLTELGEVTYASYRKENILLVGEDLIDTLSGYHVFITEVDIVDAEVLQHLPDLRVAISCRGNPVNVDLEACTAAGVAVMNTPGRNAEAVAELTILYLLMFSRKMTEAAEFLRRPGGEAGDMGRMGMAYSQLQGNELWGKTLGIIGAGAVGRQVIKRASSFGMQILVYDPQLDSEQISMQGAVSVSLDKLLTESDFVSLHAAVTDETRGMFNDQNLFKMKDGSFLINTARAALVDETALIEALEKGKLGGVALDVFEVEPPGADHPLLAFPNVIATPHIGGNTYEVAVHQGEIVLRNLESLLSKTQPENILNPEVLQFFKWTGERVVQEGKLEMLMYKSGPGVSDLDVVGQEDSTVKHVKHTERGTSLRSIRKPNAAGNQENQNMTTDKNSTADSGDLEVLRGKFVQILELFLIGIAEDAQLAKFAEKRDVVFHFTLRTLGITFYMDFINGEVEAGMGAPQREPDVNLKMSADTLDGMFTNRIKAMSAAMSGKLSFSGNTKKAMAFQRVQKDMQRIYQDARSTVGDPGDLAMIDESRVKASNVQASGVAALDRAGSDATGASVRKIGDIRDEILLVNNELYERRYITPTGGNVSARVAENHDEIWITPSQIFKGDLGPEMMLRIDLDGHLIEQSEWTASSERRVHCAIYRARPDVMAVVHSHAPQATMMALTGLEFLPVSTEAAMIGDIPVVPFIMPGSDELGDAVAEALGGGMAVLMQNHGLVVACENLRRAADVTDLIEVNAEKIITCKKLGVDPPVLPDDIVQTLREIGGMAG